MNIAIHLALLRKIFINKNDIFEEKRIANNNLVINIGLNMADDIPMAKKSSQSYLHKTNETIKDQPIAINELKDVFFSLKKNKSTKYHEITFYILKITLVNFVIRLITYLTYHSKKVFFQTI